MATVPAKGGISRHWKTGSHHLLKIGIAKHQNGSVFGSESAN
jgi:hypothetical protein